MITTHKKIPFDLSQDAAYRMTSFSFLVNLNRFAGLTLFFLNFRQAIITHYSLGCLLLNLYIYIAW